MATSSKVHTVSCELGGKTLTIETGKLAKQANASVWVSYGDTRVLVTACCSKDPKEGIDFFPLTVEFQEKFYAAGKIPGGFTRREGRPTSEATLSARMIDRPIRPLFPEGFRNDTQVVATIMSLDLDADADVAASIGASAALHISDIPFNGPTASCRVGRKDGNILVNPSWTLIHDDESDYEIMVTGTAKAIMMIEGGANQVPEEEVLQGILKAHEEIKRVCKMIEELRAACGKPKMNFVPAKLEADITSQIEKLCKSGLTQALRTKDKGQRYSMVGEVKKAALAQIITDEMWTKSPDEAGEREKKAKTAFELLQYNLMREMILTDKIRIDGRDSKTIRQISVETGILPRAHGSGLFTRGETQVLAAVTLGTSDDEQIIDSVYQSAMRKYMLHYNFAPFSVGETGRFGGNSRREIGHGALAERAVKAILPAADKFPYTLRIVCETLESNGSSSMGSVCSASMALMDAGVQVLKPVAGIAMGLIKEDSRVAILSDILGDEDHLGDMDFKVAGTKDGITAIQMDIKIEGVDEAIMRTALKQAHEGRLHILGEMAKAIQAPKTDMSAHAPRITTIQIPVDKIREVIGSGGKVIREIIAQSGTKIDINDDGKINIASSDKKATEKALELINAIIAEVEVGKVYNGVVKKIVDFGAFVAVLPNQEGLLHVSEIAHERVNNVTDYLKEGDTIDVKVIDVDKTGRIRLSRKVLLPRADVPPPAARGTSGEIKRAQPRSDN